MSLKIAVASGKGGTGKTSVSLNLYHFIARDINKSVYLVDCDVEEPNDHLFFSDLVVKKNKTINQEVPQINTKRCTFCRECVDYCEFNAISIIPTVEFAEINKDLCHSCGACLHACKQFAIVEKPYEIGEMTYYKTREGKGLAEGRLRIGSTMQTRVIKELKMAVDYTAKIMLYDAPPGTSCPVVETVSDVDYVILVTEPTPFGLNDLKLMVELLFEIKKPFGVILNKAGLGNNDVYAYLEERGIELLAEIPFDKEYASLYSKGQLLENIPANIEEQYLKVLKKIEGLFK